MYIHELYIYPIKSVRPIPLPSTSIHAAGPLHDRIFLLQHEQLPTDDSARPSYQNMHITDYPQLSLFIPSFHTPDTLLLRYTPPASSDHELMIPLSPSTTGLVEREVIMHQSACTGYDMGDVYAAFFTSCLRFPVRLVYLGPSRRAVLGNVAPAPGAVISFADCAPLLIATRASIDAVSERMKGGELVDITKFRPNIVLARDDGEELQAWEEDFWGEVEIEGAPVVLSANCLRCKSVNVDYNTGAPAESDRQPLKLLMKDRRVDPGMKYSPAFGRYGFLKDTGTEMVVNVGDKVVVSKRNAERTVFYWPGLSTGT